MCPAINNQILGLRGLGKSSLFTNETSQTLLIDKYLTTVVESTYTNGSNLFKKNLHPCVHNSHQTCLSNRTLHLIKVMKSLILTPKKTLEPSPGYFEFCIIVINTYISARLTRP